MTLTRNETYTERVAREQEEARRVASQRTAAPAAAASASAGGISARPAPAAPPAAAPSALRGARKVGAFPERSKYPFRQIADDGGVWELDPATFKVTPAGIVQAARKWAETHDLAVKAVTDSGMVYVQLTSQAAARRDELDAAVRGKR